MVLRMTSPMRRNGSSIHYLRKRLPADLIAKMRGTELRIPVGDEVAVVRVGTTGTIKVSLRTHDPGEAKQRQAKALAHLDDVWRSVREGPCRLTNRRVVALAGEWYREAKATWEDDPGRATMWNVLHQASLKWDAVAARKQMEPYACGSCSPKGLCR